MNVLVLDILFYDVQNNVELNRLIVRYKII